MGTGARSTIGTAGSWHTSSFPFAPYVVKGVGPNDVYCTVLIGYSILHSVGDDQWTEDQNVYAPTNGQQEWVYMDLWGSSPDNVYLIGGGDFSTNGVIVHGDGAGHWTLVRDDLPPLMAIWGSSATDVYAVGAKGTIVHLK
jgi:hypothetical protein